MNHYSSFKTHLAKVSLTCICFFLVLWSTAQINEDQSTGNVAIGGDVDNNFKLTVDGRMQITGELLSTETHFTFANGSGHGAVNWGGAGVGDMHFRTLSVLGNRSTYSTRMIILNDGKIGIGTTSPNAKLDVSGNIRSTSGLITALNPSNSDATLSLSWLNDVARIRVGGSGNGAGSGFDIQGPGNASLLRVKGNGNVLIGKSSQTDDAYKLDVEGKVKTSSEIHWGNTGAALTRNQGAAIELRGSGTPFIDFSNDTSTDYDARFILRANDRVEFAGANLLIGKSTQSNTSYKLDVAGKVRADEIVVNTTGADYVFEEDYKLKSLDEVETFINQNKHLSGIPSAAEMQAQGMSVGELNTKLLEKIEELTLHTINQQKEIEQLKAEKASLQEGLEGKMQEMEKTIDSLIKAKSNE
ncbi:MAG: hypothetical protein AAF149_22235 [Bacteroidota bacterium]